MTQIMQKHYKLQWQEHLDHWSMDLQVNQPYHHTANFPLTHSILKEKLPMILECQCFNDAGLPFHQELQATETGHLLEHILLEHLCEDKISQGHNSADFSGVTSWNWIDETTGTFHIKIEKDQLFASDFQTALYKSLKLLEEIFATTNAHSVTHTTVALAPELKLNA